MHGCMVVQVHLEFYNDLVCGRGCKESDNIAWPRMTYMGCILMPCITSCVCGCAAIQEALLPQHLELDGIRPATERHACMVCVQAGVAVCIHHLPDTVSQVELERAVSAVCEDPSVDGVLVQLPLPRHLDEEKVMEHLDPKKDVDGFHPLNMGWVNFP